MSGNGGRACELSVGVHSAHRVGHTVGSGACCHIVGVKGTSRTAVRCNGEVLNAVFNAQLLVSACNGVLESCGVGGVSGDGNANVLKLLFFVCFFDFYLYNTTKFRANQKKDVR